MSPNAGSLITEAHLRTKDAISTGVRKLLPEEKAELFRRGTRSLAAGCALLLPAPILFLVSLGALALVSGPDGSINARAVGVMVLMLVVLPLMLVIGSQSYRQGSRMRLDARRGEVYQFQPISPDQPPITGAEAREQPSWFEVLPTTRLIWRTETGLPPAQKTVDFVAVADTPERAATAAQWTEPLDPVQAPGLEVNHRELTAAERNELLRHIHQVALTPLRAAVPLTLWAGAVLYLAAQAGRFPAGYRLASFLLLLAVTAIADLAAVIGFRTAWKLRKDHHVGRVIIVRLSQSDNQATEQVGTAELSPPSEFLPFSRRSWTFAGHPVHWRVKSGT